MGPDAAPVIIRVVSGKGNYISDNHIVATTEGPEVQAAGRAKGAGRRNTGGPGHADTGEAGSCFSAQVGELLTAGELWELEVITVLVESAAFQNTVLDSESDAQVIMDRTINAFRATPTPGRNG